MRPAGIGGAKVHQAFRAQDVLVRVALADAEQVGRLRLAIARALGGRDDEGAGASEMRQQSSMFSGAAICFEPITSSIVIGCFMCELG